MNGHRESILNLNISTVIWSNTFSWSKEVVKWRVTFNKQLWSAAWYHRDRDNLLNSCLSQGNTLKSRLLVTKYHYFDKKSERALCWEHVFFIKFLLLLFHHFIWWCYIVCTHCTVRVQLLRSGGQLWHSVYTISCLHNTKHYVETGSYQLIVVQVRNRNPPECFLVS